MIKYHEEELVEDQISGCIATSLLATGVSTISIRLIA